MTPLLPRMTSDKRSRSCCNLPIRPVFVNSETVIEFHDAVAELAALPREHCHDIEFSGRDKRSQHNPNNWRVHRDGGTWAYNGAMNYLAHGWRFVEEPYLLAGTAAPDWMSVIDRKI